MQDREVRALVGREVVEGLIGVLVVVTIVWGRRAGKAGEARARAGALARS